METEQRQYVRIPFREPVGFRMRGPKGFGGCLAYDLSENGIRINFDQFVPLHSNMDFQMQFGNNPELFNVKGRVVWVQKVPHSERYQVGLQFEDADVFVQSQQKIHEYIQFIRSHRN